MEPDVRRNTDLKMASGVYRLGIERILEKNARMIDHLKKSAEIAQNNMDNSQTVDVQAGFMPDDDSDIIKEIKEIEEELIKNLGEIERSIVGTTKATSETILSSGYMRLDKSQGDIKTFPNIATP
jgi:hypothetical protein